METYLQQQQKDYTKQSYTNERTMYWTNNTVYECVTQCTPTCKMYTMVNGEFELSIYAYCIYFPNHT